MQTISLDKLLDTIMKLDFYSREMLVEILRKRQIEESRKIIQVNAKKAKSDFLRGKYKPQTAEQVISLLNSF